MVRSAVQRLEPGAAGSILHWLGESKAAAEARALWFKPLVPSMRYTLDVVAGPWNRNVDRDRSATDTQGTLEAIFTATDAEQQLHALKAYYNYEDSLTTLERVQFTTLRYARFSDQMANIAVQIQGIPARRRFVITSPRPTRRGGSPIQATPTAPARPRRRLIRPAPPRWRVWSRRSIPSPTNSNPARPHPHQGTRRS